MLEMSSQPGTSGGTNRVGGATRLMITHMVLNNFKSYAGRVEIGPFHHQFTSIVGPNGSGKSNVIDAMLFVFGFRASQIRLKKISELIHKSDSHPDCNKAQVDVYFQEVWDLADGGFDVVPESKFSVTRTASSSNQSQYYINDRKSKAEDVIEFLKSKGVDLTHNRFLILQGEVEQIALMKPRAPLGPPGPDGRPASSGETGMLEYLEDIIGTNVYNDQIAALAHKVDELNEERAQRLHRVQIVEKDLSGLEGAKDEAIMYLEHERRAQEHRWILYQLQLKQIESTGGDTETQLAELRARLEEDERLLREAQKHVTETERRYEQQKKEYDRIAREMEKSKSDFAAFERKDIKYREDLKHLQKKIKKMQQCIKEAHSAVQHARSQISEAEQDEHNLEAQRTKLQPQLEREEAALERMTEKTRASTEHLRVQLEKLQKEIMPFKKQESEVLAKIDLTRSELDLIESKRRAIEEQLRDVTEKLEAANRTIEEKRRERAATEDQLRRIDERLASSKDELNRVSADETRLSSEHQSLRAKLDDTKQSAAEATNRGTLVNEIMKAAARHELKGVHRRLGDLGAIDKKYDIAISTACPQLSHIVVETTEAGKHCVAFLKEKKLGTATFLPLDMYSREQFEQASASQTAKIARIQEREKGVFRLFDLIRSKDDRYRPLFYAQLRDTLVAENLEQATRIAYGETRFRVVTLDGSLIETSGTMSGGGNQVSRGGMGSSITADSGISPEEIKQMEGECAQLSAKVTQTRARRAELGQLIKQLETERLHIRGEAIPKFDMDIQATDTLIKTLSNRISKELKPQLRQCEESTEDEQKIAGLKQRIATLEKNELNKIRQQSETLEKRIAELQEKISEAGGVELKTQKFQVENLNREIDECGKKIAKAQVTRESAEKQIKKSEKQIKKEEVELGVLKSDEEKMMKEFKSLEDDAFKVQETFTTTQHVLDEKADELKQMKTEYDEHKKKVDELRARKIDTDNKISDIERTVEECRVRIAHIESKLNALEEEMQKPNDLDVMDEPAGTDPSVGGTNEANEENDAEDVDELDMEEDDEFESDEEQPASTKQKRNQKALQKKVATKKRQQKGKKSIRKGRATAHQGQMGGIRRGGVVDVSQRLSEEQLGRYDEKKLEYEITVCTNTIKEMRPNLGSIEEFRKKDRDFKQRVAELEQITNQRNQSQKDHDDMRKKRLEEFMRGFSTISMKLKEMYQMITLGGDAELELVDSLDPFSEGIVFSVRPPRKSWKNITNLSGGEKTLSSLALVFALHHYKPTPLYVMDEIDAALDFKNVSIVANYIKERTKNAQFVIISLRNNMFELADRLVGIYKTDNCTKSVTIDPLAIARICTTAADEPQRPSVLPTQPSAPPPPLVST